jgi:RNA polymerase sigma-70 factor (ECF subfamily)
MEPNDCGGGVHGVRLTFDAFWTDQRERIGRALAMTIGDIDLATEAVDEAMARAYQRWNRVGSLENPAGWVYRVGLNWTRSIHRRRRRIPPAWLATPQASTDDSGLDPSIDSAMAALPEAQRAVVVCRVLLGWSEAQTATVLHVRPGTVKSRLSRALDELAVTLNHLDPKENVR